VFTPELLLASRSFARAVKEEVESQLEDLLVCLGQEEQKVRVAPPACRTRLLSRVERDVSCESDRTIACTHAAIRATKVIASIGFTAVARPELHCPCIS
jgi:hypothetical protein